MQEIIEHKRLNEKMIYRQMPNGLDVYIIPKKGYSKQFAVYIAHYGSNDSEFIAPGDPVPIRVPDGIAHFLEHKLFEEKEGNIFEEYSRLGAQPNAFTNFTTTAYHFTSTENFYEALGILVDFVGRPYFTDENVEKEKGIISQEIKMYEDNPQWKVYFNLLKGLYQSYPVRKEITGTVDSIQEITKEILYKCYETFYHPSNMVLFAAGDIDPGQMFDTLIKRCKENRSIKKWNVERIFPREPHSVNQALVEEKLAVHRPIFALGFKDTKVGQRGKELLKKIIAQKILLELLLGSSSDLYNDLYEKGLIDNSFYADFIGEVDYGHVVISGETDQPEVVVEKIYEEIEKKKEDFWPAEDFLRIKKKKAGEFIRIFNSVEAIGFQFISYYFNKIHLFDYIDLLEDIHYYDVIRSFNDIFDKGKSSLSVIRPKIKKSIIRPKIKKLG